MMTNIRMATKHKAPKRSRATTGKLDTGEKRSANNHRNKTVLTVSFYL